MCSTLLETFAVVLLLKIQARAGWNLVVGRQNKSCGLDRKESSKPNNRIIKADIKINNNKESLERPGGPSGK